MESKRLSNRNNSDGVPQQEKQYVKQFVDESKSIHRILKLDNEKSVVKSSDGRVRRNVDNKRLRNSTIHSPRTERQEEYSQKSLDDVMGNAEEIQNTLRHNRRVKMADELMSRIQSNGRSEMDGLEL